MSTRPILAALAAALLCATAGAEPAPAPPAAASPPPGTPVVLPQLPDAYIPTRPDDDSLYRALGGADGIAALVDEFQRRLRLDARIEPFFRDADRAYVKAQLQVQICEVAGGPCNREKRNIRRSHSGHDIRMADFNAVVEILQQAMDARGIAFGDQNRLLAQLAPMHRDIVNTH